MPQIDTTIPVSASGVTAGQPVDFKGEIASSVSITNNSGFSIQYSTGGAFTTVANGASASIGGVDPASFRIRKAALDASPGYPLQVDMSWVYGDDEVRASQLPGGGVALEAGGEVLDVGRGGGLSELATASEAFRSSAALFVSTPLNITPTQITRAVRINWVDLAPPAGWTTDAAGYAVGSKTLNTPAGASGAVYRGDLLRIGSTAETYRTVSIDTDLSNASSVTLAGSGVAVAVPAAATALTLLERGQKIYGAFNCDNATEAAVACQNASQRDFEMTLGTELIVTSTDPITSIWITSAVDGVPINLHRLEIFLGA